MGIRRLEQHPVDRLQHLVELLLALFEQKDRFFGGYLPEQVTGFDLIDDRTFQVVYEIMDE